MFLSSIFFLSFFSVFLLFVPRVSELFFSLQFVSNFNYNHNRAITRSLSTRSPVFSSVSPFPFSFLSVCWLFICPLCLISPLLSRFQGWNWIAIVLIHLSPTVLPSILLFSSWWYLFRAFSFNLCLPLLLRPSRLSLCYLPGIVLWSAYQILLISMIAVLLWGILRPPCEVIHGANSTMCKFQSNGWSCATVCSKEKRWSRTKWIHFQHFDERMGVNLQIWLQFIKFHLIKQFKYSFEVPLVDPSSHQSVVTPLIWLQSIKFHLIKQFTRSFEVPVLDPHHPSEHIDESFH